MIYQVGKMVQKVRIILISKLVMMLKFLLIN
nr:MAG TPA: hypothetical protein [Caudoviricetes sp.]DAK59233.1 MAG TPA: hypothetical protein [Caudoviricetes sp.]